MNTIKKTLISFLLCFIAIASSLYGNHFDFSGRILNSHEHFELVGNQFLRVGCFVDIVLVNEPTPFIRGVLIRGADGNPCSAIYRINRRIYVEGHYTPTIDEVDYFTWLTP